ncbi:HlyD family secretion protein [Runella sp. SP2]|uniref:HlyD family secretion protein n=1 Tax=Runella sp. SP2 TaxID=2268026 RepID=UPI000F083B54|nr:HlyD family efflux transporter periplasmic adaptor subunit [Runella sp. SP2]AYQ33143.1 HlyD family efflux transporter periplasmic adaptor subunit [Runella sp. SP2]
MAQLLPDSFIDNTTHLYLPKVKARSMVLYALVLGAVIVFGVAAFFIKIDVSFTSSGTIRSVAEKTEVRSLVSGRVLTAHVRENQLVKVGDILLTLAPDALEEKLRLSHFQQSEQQQLINDLIFLTSPKYDLTDALGNRMFKTSLYAQQYNQLQAQLKENEVRRNKVEKELKADKYLHSEKVLATRDLDAKQAEYDQLYEEYRLLIERQVSQWEAELNTAKLLSAQLKSEEGQLAKERQLYTIKAAVAGTVQQWAGKYEGSVVQSGETLGIISPDSSLLVECYIKASDMGLLKLKQTVLFQLDALNYREWGLARGSVIDIARDFTLINNQPVFKVKCRLDTPSLKLQNGYEARLQKGMTLQARFVIVQRTLAQLVFDKMEDWLNPNAKRD